MAAPLLSALIRRSTSPKKPRAGEEGDIENHITGHEINPPSPNIWPSLSLTLKLLSTPLHEDFVNPLLSHPKERV